MLVWLVLALRSGAAQAAGSSAAAGPAAPAPWTISLDLIADAGRDRFAVVTLARGPWKLQNINWTDPDGESALSVLLLGRRFSLSRRVEVTVLAGPWYSYEDHAWNEMVLATHLTLHGRRLRFSATNYWGGPLSKTGYFFASHTQTLTGLPHLPNWLGICFLEKHGSDGLERLFLGPEFSRRHGAITVSAYPYWDVTRRTLDVRVGVSYTRTFHRSERE